jgi:hypothetical protein
MQRELAHNFCDIDIGAWVAQVDGTSTTVPLVVWNWRREGSTDCGCESDVRAVDAVPVDIPRLIPEFVTSGSDFRGSAASPVAAGDAVAATNP